MMKFSLFFSRLIGFKVININGAPLQLACYNNNIDAVKLLLSCRDIQVNFTCYIILINYLLIQLEKNNFFFHAIS